MSCKTRAYIAVSPRRLQLFDPARRPGLRTLAVMKNLASASGQTTVPISRPSSTAPATIAGGIAGEVTLPVEHGGPDRRDGRDLGGGRAGRLRRGSRGPARISGCSALAAAVAAFSFGRIKALAQNSERRPRDRASRYRGRRSRNAPASRRASVPLPGRRRTVDRDDKTTFLASSIGLGDHGAEAVHQVDEAGEAGVDRPRRRRSRPASRAAMPSTRKDMAMRWSSFTANAHAAGRRLAAA